MPKDQSIIDSERSALSYTQMAAIGAFIVYVLFGHVFGDRLARESTAMTRLVVYVLIGVAAFWCFRRELVSGWRATRIAPWRFVGWGAFGFVAAYLLGIITTTIFIHLGVSPDGENAQSTAQLQMLAKSSALLASLLFVASGIVGPVLEEVIFREVLIGKLAHRIPSWMALIVSSALFGAMHLRSIAEWPLLLNYGLVGLLLGALYLLSQRNIFVPIAVHVAWNTMGFVSSMSLS
ncbi:lysostaphin resistance A-like protein [Leucobacter sp. NPDC077196]|uniref:CPBP family intramembrane glutamic endopeptidase n=1 Tax=Leucobacter sp. NPDC077196 TaxID=3154959 RepID=UPI00341D26CB